MIDEFVIFFASFNYEGDRYSAGTTGADISHSIDGALELARARFSELSSRAWCASIVIKIVRASDGECVSTKNWSRP